MPTKNLRNILLLLAWESIAQGLKTGKPLRINLDDYPEELSQRKGCFVVLKQKQLLRGCVGSIEPIRPLGEDVAENAFAAAFCDRHFMPLADNELEKTQINILLLSALEPMQCDSQLQLTQQLRPHVDGLLIREGSHHANLLPTAWDTFRTPLDFVNHLKQQAGLPLTYWSKNTQIFRYTAETLSDETKGENFS
jgi:AmmeMemoRadiSam system protein A